jgi:outer membrane protein insertion porin family
MSPDRAWGLVALVLSALPYATVHAEEILRSVRFQGRESLPEPLLLEASGLKPGSAWDPALAGEARKRLERLRFVDSVSEAVVATSPDGSVDVAFEIRERPVVVSVAIEGNERVPTAPLRALLRTRVGEPLEGDVLDADREALRARCQEDGFLLASVESLVERLPLGRAEVVFRITEGHRVSIEDVEVEGNQALSRSRIIEALGLRPERLFGVVDRGDYRPAELDRGIERVRDLYAARGYLGALVELEDVSLDPRLQRLRLRLRVEEGRRFVVDRVQVLGNRSFPEEVLDREVDVPAGSTYDGDAMRDAADRIARFYQEHSDRVPSVRVVHRQTGPDRVAVAFEIEEGRHLFTGRVDITGNWKTRDRVVRQVLGLVPGEPLTRLGLEDARRRLSELAYFDAVSFSLRPTDDPSVEDVHVRVEERTYLGFLEVGGGASTGEGEVGFVRVSQPNFDLFRLPRSLTDWRGAFSGGGQQLVFELVPGSRESQYVVRFREPWLFSSSRVLDVSASNLVFDRGPYDEERASASVEVRQFLDASRRLSAALAYHVEAVRIDDLDDLPPPDVFTDRGSTLVAFPRASLRYDTLATNAYSGPDGLRAELRYDLPDDAFGSERDFSRAAGTLDFFAGLFGRSPDFRHTLHVGVEAGWSDGRSGDDVPFYERFFLGGPRSFRGFDYRGVGPHQRGTAVGGQALLRGTVEYSLPLFLRELRVVGVFDWGAIESDPSRFSTGRIRTAAGGGLQLRLPILGGLVPVNLYALQALSSEEGDEEQIFTFTLGYGF